MLRKTTIFLYLLFTIVILVSTKPIQLAPTKLTQAIHDNQFTLIYFYSTTCQYCKQFSPKFEQLQKINAIPGLVFAKMDGPSFKEITDKYQIYSYPTIVLFWKGIDQPIFYLMQRQVDKILPFLKIHTKQLSNIITKAKYEKLTEQQKFNMITYFGPPECYQVNVTTVLSFIEPYRKYLIFHANVTQPYLLIKNKTYYNFDIEQLLIIIRTQFADLHRIEQQPWRKIFQRKQVGITYVNVGGIKGRDQKLRVEAILKKLSKQFPNVVFMILEPSQEQFKQALGVLGVQHETNIYGVQQKYDAKFSAPKPYTEQSLRSFIQQVLNVTAPLYMRSQKTNNKQKLTLQNFDQKVIKQPKDVVLFIYRTQDRLQAKFMDLFRYLTEKLKQNKNISLLRCNLSKNEIQMKLQMQVKVTPLIIFYGHRMKEKPVQFSKSLISTENVIQFIMENTTFDWEDQWGEL